MKKRAVAFLMSLTLAIGNMISMPTYAAQETTVESVEDITAEEEAGGTEAQDESEEVEGADSRAEAVVSEEESASEGTDESESAADTDGEAVTEADEEEEGETVTEEILTDEEGTEAAAEVVKSGSCGESAYYSLSGTTGDLTLSITGSGDMDDYKLIGRTTTAPWADWNSQITNLSVAEEISSIGDYSFYGLSKIPGVKFSNNLKEIGSHAFDDCDGISNLKIPGNVESIGKNAFGSIDNLSNVTLGDGIHFIDEYAFYGCKNLLSINLPESLEEIGAYAFCSCKSLGNVSIPDGIEVIHDNTFRDCKVLGTADIPASVTSIGYYAFYGCSNLSNVELPDDLTEINDCAFGFCSSFTRVDLPAKVTQIAYGCFMGCTNLETIDIPDGVTSIGDYAFDRCSSLKNIRIPKGVTRIEAWTFNACSSLSSINILGKITEIEGQAFQNCSSLEQFTINEGVEYLDLNTFLNCSSLRSIKIPKSLKYIDRSVFTGCSGLQDVYYASGEEDWKTLTDPWRDSNLPLVNANIHFNSLITGTIEMEPKILRTVGETFTISAVYKGQNAVSSASVDSDAGEALVIGEVDIWDPVENGSEIETDLYFQVTAVTKGKYNLTLTTDDGTAATVEVEIASKDVADAEVQLDGVIKDENGNDCCAYTGKQIKPGVAEVKLGGRVLNEGADYTVQYGKNINIGSGTVTIIGTGEYTGQKDVSFIIIPAKVQNLKKTENACDENNTNENVGAKHRALEVEWDSQTGVDGYSVEYSDDISFAPGSEINITEEVNSNSYTAEDLERKKNLYVRVRSYKTVNGTKYYGEYSDVLSYEICSHLLVTDFWGFDNLGHRIPRGIFETLYPPAQVDMIINDSGKNGENGICFGMSNLAVSILCSDDFNIKPSDFNVESLYDLKSLDQDSWAQYLIRLTTTLQSRDFYENEINNISTFLSMVEEYTEKGIEPVNFAVFNVDFWNRNKREGHNLVALDIVEKTDSQVKIRVYDCNYPGEDKYIYLYADNEPGNYNRWKYESGFLVMGTLQGGSTELTGGFDNDYIRVYEKVKKDILSAIIIEVSGSGSYESDYYDDWLLTVESQPDNTDNSFWDYVIDRHNAELIENTGTGQENEEENTLGSFWVPKTADDTLNLEGVPAGTELHLAGNYHSVTITVSEECDLRVWLPETGEGEVEVTSDQDTDVQVVFQDFDEDGLKSKKTFTENVEAGSSVEIVKNVGDSDYAAAGDLNQSISWKLDKDEVLTISGNGPMPDYVEPEWLDYRDNIYKIVIEDGVTTVGGYDFEDCRNCRSVSIPGSVTEIKNNAFSGCTALEELSLKKGLKHIYKEAFLDCDSLVSVVIPEGVDNVEDYAFARCDHLKSVSIPKSMEAGGDYIFADDVSLENVQMKAEMWWIPEGMFFNCRSLKTITIPEGNRLIGVSDFENCESLQSITLPKSLGVIEENAFKNCKNLTTVIYKGTKSEWKLMFPLGSGNNYIERAKVKCSDGYLKLVSALQITLPKTAYPYTGKAITPAVTLKSGSITLKNGTHYTVKYTNNTKVGTATITITGKGAYWGTVKKTFKIYPKGTSIVSLTPGSKQFTVKWNKQATQTTGYQIQCCTDKTFKSGVKIVTVNGTAYTSRKVTVSKSKTTYYVRMRTFKKNASGALYYSGWSAVKSVKTK